LLLSQNNTMHSPMIKLIELPMTAEAMDVSFSNIFSVFL
jgi:hypothetical protein